MGLKNSIIRFNHLLSGIAFFIAVAISCNQHSESKPKSVNNLDKSQLQKMTDNYYQGKSIFKKYCHKCHVEPERRMTDQYLFDNLFDRLPPPPEVCFIKYIQDSKLLKASGDTYAKKIDEAWDSKYEHYFRDSLSQQDFGSLIIYIKVAAKRKYQNNRPAGGH